MTRSILVAMVVAAIGCGAEAPDNDDNQPDVVEDATKADVIYPSGTYTDASPSVGELVQITLNGTKTFERRTMTVDCVPQLHCNPNEHGTYKFSYSGANRYIRFYDDHGTFIDRYQWKLTTASLSLRHIGGSTWQKLKPAPNVAGEGESCGGFVAHPRQCAAGLNCIFSHVPDVPGTCVDPLKTACAAAGGSCVALAPGTCDNGAIGDATQYSCGGGLGVECCLPKPAPTGPACKSASDCTGPLPHFCKLCDDGSSACAHYTCEQKHCTILTCG